MKKNTIALLLSIVLAVSSITAAPALAAETTAEEAVPAEEEYDQEQETQQGFASDTGTVEEEQGEEGQSEEIQEDDDQSLEDASESSDEAEENDPLNENEDSEQDAQEESIEDVEQDAEGAQEQGEDSVDPASGNETEEIVETGSTESAMKDAELAVTETKAATEVVGLAVDSHTQDQIRQFIRNNPAPMIPNTYAEEPSVKIPYSPGVVSDRSTEAAFNALNQMRYVAGIPASVEYSSNYTAQAQAGALVNAVNNSLSHFPSQPEGMDDDLYQLGYNGASSSNIAWGTSSLAESVRLWMSDSDSSNIDRLGHRRWILNPAMKKSGFGAVNSFSAVYAFDESGGSTSYSRVAWPAQNMPLEFWDNGDAWSVSFGKSITMANVQVTLTRKGDGQVWTFSSDEADGYFNVENSNYGQRGCVIFRPSNISYSSGDQFDVKISGAIEADVAYTVSFFALCGGNHSYTSEKLSDPTCTARGVTLKICSDCGDVTYEYTPANGHNYQVTGGENGVYTMKCDVCGDEITAAVPSSITPFWREEGATGYYSSNVPSGLKAGDAVEYLIRIDSYTADAGSKLNDITLESSDPEHCIVQRSDATSGMIRFLEAGNYTITIYPTYNPDYRITRQIKIVKPVESVTILANPGPPQVYGSTIRLEAGVDGGKGTLYYTFVSIDGNGTENVIRRESTSSTCTWTPGATGTYSLRVDVRDAGDDNRVVSSSLLSYTVVKQPIRVKDNKQITANGTLTYGQALSELQVNNAAFVGQRDGASLTGTFSWEDPEEVLSAGTHRVSWIFTPNNANYEELTGSLSVQVEKAVPVIATVPNANAVSYHPNLKLADIAMTGGKVTARTSDGNLEGSWEWTAPDTSLTVPGGTYTCRFVPADAVNYESVETEANVTVGKASPFIAGITAQDITYGQFLADSTLTGNVQYSENDDTAVSGSFQWADGTIAPVVSDSGKTLYRVIFTPADTNNYETVEGQTTLTVKKAKKPSETPPAEVHVSYSTDKLSNEILRTVGILNWSFSNASIGNALEVGSMTFTVSYTGSDKGNYETETARIKVTRDPCDHNGTVTVRNAEEPTCTKEGKTGDKFCDICGELLEASVAIPVIDHNWAAEYSIDREPTCAEEGSESIHCTVCGGIKEGSARAIEKLAHTYGGWNTVKAATCTQAGSRKKVCSVCGDTVTESIPATGHDWGEWTVVREATEEEEGLERRTCKNDSSHTEERSIPKLNHVHELVKTDSKAATCMEAGNIEYWTCSKCGRIYLDKNGSKETDLEETVIPAKGHTWAADYTVDKTPTCTEEGSESIHCTVCGEIKEGSARTVEKVAHTYGGWTTVKAATCLNAGSRKKVCSVCGDTVTEAIPATGHDWGEWTVVREATEEEEGLARRFCKNDSSHTQARNIPKLDHVHELVKTDSKAATCAETGNIEYWTCSKCGRIYLDQNGSKETDLEETVIPAKGHTWATEYTVDKEPTETEDGSKSIHCTVCDTVKEGSAVPIPWQGKDISGLAVNGIANKTYTGQEVTQNIVIKDGDYTLVQNTDYTVSYKDNINAGTATVIIKGAGSYTGTVTKTFMILPGKTTRGDMFNLANNVKVTWTEVPGAKYYKVYREGVTNRKETISEPVIVTTGLVGWDKEPGLTNGHAYRYKIVASLTGKGDSSGDSTLSYSKLMYRLKTVVIRSVKNTAPGKVTVKYDKTTSGDSYVLQYSEREDMSDAKTKVVIGANNTSYVIGGLKKGKTYYISIRVRKKVDGIDYYTTFGVAKKVKVEK